MNRLGVSAAALGMALATAAHGTTLAFSGTFTNTNAPGAPGGRCAVATVTISNTAPFSASGTSNFGAFTAVQSHCLDSGPPLAVGAPPTPYYDGLFTYSFATGATLSGTYTGVLTNGGSFGLVDNVQDFVVTGGTGQFAHATGMFTGNGDIRFGMGRPTATLTITDGLIDVGAVPEPATWGLMIAGFGASGAMLRNRRRAFRAHPAAS